MVRQKKEEWQKPVAGAGKETSGGEKRRKKKLEEESARKQGNPLDKFLVKRAKVTEEQRGDENDDVSGPDASNSVVPSPSSDPVYLEEFVPIVPQPAVEPVSRNNDTDDE